MSRFSFRAMFKKVPLILWAYRKVKLFIDFVFLFILSDRKQLNRFSNVAGHYEEMVNHLNTIWPENTIEDLHSGYDWSSKSSNIHSSFSIRIPLDFLWHPMIVRTMFAGTNSKEKITAIVHEYGPRRARMLLREDIVGLPRISNWLWKTSDNRTDHAFHLASYHKLYGRNIFDVGTIIEWGGGYGNLARIIRRITPNITYIIIDLPELCALQYAYLYATDGTQEPHLLDPDGNIIMGRTNILPVNAVLNRSVDLHCDAFISTWALTESPKEAQLFVLNNNFFDAERLLLAYCLDSNNYLSEKVVEKGCTVHPVPFVFKGNEYALK
ncbi:MAG: hypothetical protein ABSD46_03670 [Bacteroidota bacterium]